MLIASYDDLEEDLAKGRYNPLRNLYTQTDYEKKAGDILCMMIGECSGAFEQLPCLQDIEILRNILYDGVWNRYRLIQKKKQEERDKNEQESL